MINSKELRQGNYLNTPRADQNPFRVDYFDNDKVYQNNGTYKMDLGATEFTIPFHPLTWDLKDCSPIPLSPEILQNAGFKFKKCGISGADMWQGMDIWEYQEPYTLERLTFRGNISTARGGSLKLSGYINTNYQYVHQIQNAIYFLTSQELTINLK